MCCAHVLLPCMLYIRCACCVHVMYVLPHTCCVQMCCAACYVYMHCIHVWSIQCARVHHMCMLCACTSHMMYLHIVNMCVVSHCHVHLVNTCLFTHVHVMYIVLCVSVHVLAHLYMTHIYVSEAQAPWALRIQSRDQRQLLKGSEVSNQQ